MAEERNVRHELPEGPDEDEQGVHDDYQDSEFGGAETSVGQLELILQVSIGIYIDCQCKIHYKNEHGDVEAHKHGESHSDQHEDLVYDIHSVVYVETIDRPLGLSYARYRAVEGIAIPVDDEAEGGEP